MSGYLPSVPPTLATDERENAADDNEYELQDLPDSAREGSRSESHTRDVTPYSLFSSRQKMQITILVSLASLFSPMSATIYTPALPTIARELNVSISLVNLSVTSYMIFQGLSPSIWGSLTDVLGRRPVYLFTLLIYIGACLGLAFTTNYAELIVFRCLQSTGSASAIAIGAGVVGDITERRERGGFIGAYSAGALVGTAIGPILGGIFAQTVGWHGIFYFLIALAGFFTSILFLVLPETLRSVVGNGSVLPGKSFIATPLLPWLIPSGASVASPDTPSLPKKHVDMLGPLKMMGQADVFCGLIFTAIYYTVWQSTLVATSSLFASVYALDEISVGLSFIANGVGSVVASISVGKLMNYDYRIAQRTERDMDLADNNLHRLSSVTKQVEHIEHARLKRLPIMSVLFIGSTLAFGWCIQAETTIALPILWTFFTGFTTTAIMSMFSTLIVDWYPTAGASATAAINLARCLLGAGGTAAVQPLIERIGVGWTLTVGAGLCVAAMPLGLLVYVKGETWRKQREAALDTSSMPSTPIPDVQHHPKHPASTSRISLVERRS